MCGDLEIKNNIGSTSWTTSKATMYRDEELRPIGVLARVGHGEPTGSVVLQLEVLIGEPEENEWNNSSLNGKNNES